MKMIRPYNSRKKVSNKNKHRDPLEDRMPIWVKSPAAFWGDVSPLRARGIAHPLVCFIEKYPDAKARAARYASIEILSELVLKDKTNETDALITVAIKSTNSSARKKSITLLENDKDALLNIAVNAKYRDSESCARVKLATKYGVYLSFKKDGTVEQIRIDLPTYGKTAHADGNTVRICDQDLKYYTV
ncbi:MAG: hypothetical protein WC501_04445 [Candidatus Micrarchaeia archaeon]